MATELEKRLEERCVAKVEVRQGLSLKLVVLGLMGFPDRTCILPRRVIFFVEMKRKGKLGTVTKQQHRWRMALTLLGFGVYTIDNDEDFDAALERELNR